MIRKIPPATEFYEFYNANPKGRRTGDCGIRCVATALKISWDEAMDLLVEKGHKYKIEPFGMDAIERVLKDHKFFTMRAELVNGKKPTMQTLLRKYKGFIIVGECRRHVVCAVNGKVRDIWDSSDRPLYKYWIKAD